MSEHLQVSWLSLFFHSTSSYQSSHCCSYISDFHWGNVTTITQVLYLQEKVNQKGNVFFSTRPNRGWKSGEVSRYRKTFLELRRESRCCNLRNNWWGLLKNWKVTGSPRDLRLISPACVHGRQDTFCSAGTVKSLASERGLKITYFEINLGSRGFRSLGLHQMSCSPVYLSCSGE